jgi:NAD(P)-dependent dehydrogenase (short-subunit alcohol dehydrogenase family)
VVVSFGSVSSKGVEPDLLGRMRRILTVTPRGQSWTGSLRVLRYDAEDLEYLLREEQAALWPGVASKWPDAPARCWLPWAVVHQALSVPYGVHLHSDATCTIANAPGGRSVVGELFGDEVTWLPYATPGPALAKTIIEQATGSCVVVQHLGLFAWGDALVDIERGAASIEATAATWLNVRAPAGGRDGAPETQAAETQRYLVSIRGQMSRPRRMVLSLDPSMCSIARRDDVDLVVRVAPGAELTWPWAAAAVVVRNAPGVGVVLGSSVELSPIPILATAGSRSEDSPGTSAPARVVLVPEVGQISAGLDQVSADNLGVVAGHVHRVTAALIDLFGTFEALPGDELADLVSALDPVLEVDAAPFRGRVYIVTGAASGIGRDIARHLAAKGAQLGLGDIDAKALDRTADELEAASGRPVTVGGDLTDEAVVAELVGATVRRFGGVDGAVFNAGVAIPGEINNLSAADWRRSLDVNATSHFLLAKRLLPILQAQRLGGSLVFIGSKNMFSPGAGFGAYSASKAALAQLARTVAIEAGPFGVRSNIVNPDNVFEGSALWSPELRAQRAAVYGIRPDDLEAYYTQRNLMKVRITGLDVAKAVAFMLSDDAMRTTACVLTVDGGVPGVFPR